MAKQAAKTTHLKRLNSRRLQIKRNELLIEDKRTKQERAFPEFSTYRISWPLISADKKKALLYVENYCGIECSGGQLNLYILDENNKWKWVGAIPIGIS